MARSEWYARASARIEQVLALYSNSDLGALGEDGVRRVLRKSYPFGSRKNHPYKMWCKAVRDALERLFLPKRPADAELILAHPQGVYCSWCESGGCLMCSEARYKFARFCKEQPEDLARWLAWENAAAFDATERLILADWLDDLGFEAEAQHLRTA